MDRLALKASARESVKGYAPAVYIVTLIYLVITLVIEIVGGRINGMVTDWGNNAIQYINQLGVAPEVPRRVGLASVFSMLLEFMLQVLAVGFMSYCMRISRRRVVDTYNLGDGFSIIIKLFCVAFLQGLFITLWGFLFVVPGIIASYRYRLAYYIMLDDPDKGALQCIRESKALMDGHKMELFMLDLSFIGWQLLISITFGLVGIWKLAYIEATYAQFYNVLAYPTGEYPVDEQEAAEDEDGWNGL